MFDYIFTKLNEFSISTATNYKTGNYLKIITTNSVSHKGSYRNDLLTF